MKKIYLACPYYSADDPKVMERRFHAVTMKAAELMEGGDNVFSPITHSHPIGFHISGELRWSHDFWLSRDFQWIDVCDEIHVLCLLGWKESRGVAAEIEYAEKLGIPIIFHGVT